jgi:hypothetical protein
MFVEVVSTGGQAAVTVVGHGNDVGDAFGDDKDFVIVLNSSAKGADVEIDNVIVGTSDHQGFAANSAVLSNVTTDGDIMMLVSDGGNSKEFLFANGDTADLQLGHGMATATLKTASGALDIDGAGAVQVNSSGAAISIANDNIDQPVNIATGGTRTLNIGIDDGSDATTISIKGDVTMGGVTPRLTIGDAGTEDAAIVFDGNAQDYYIGLDDTADSLVMGKGSTLGTTAMMSIGSTPTLGINRDATSSALVAIGGALAGPDGYDASALAVTTTVSPDAADDAFIVRFAGTIAEAGSGTHGNVAQLMLDGTAVTAGSGATTNASTLYVKDAMSGATNNYSIFVDAGTSRFDGNIGATGTRVPHIYTTSQTTTNAETVDSWGRSKENITTYVKNALKIIQGIDVISFSHLIDRDPSGRIKLGLRAESIDEPLALVDRDYGYGLGAGPALDTMGLSALHTKAIQELHNKIQKLETQLAAR